MRSAASSLLLLAIMILCSQAYKIAIPRNLYFAENSPEDIGYIRKRSFDDVKRGGDRWMATVPRSGLMVGGRGWMPGFRSSSRWWDDASF